MYLSYCCPSRVGSAKVLVKYANAKPSPPQPLLPKTPVKFALVVILISHPSPPSCTVDVISSGPPTLTVPAVSKPVNVSEPPCDKRLVK